jgi:hypothetical protein
MKIYCGNCGDICGAIISSLPVEYDTSEFWGIIGIKAIEPIAIVSDCCCAAAYSNQQCTEQVEEWQLI